MNHSLNCNFRRYYRTRERCDPCWLSKEITHDGCLDQGNSSSSFLTYSGGTALASGFLGTRSQCTRLHFVYRARGVTHSDMATWQKGTSRFTCPRCEPVYESNFRDLSSRERGALVCEDCRTTGLLPEYFARVRRLEASPARLRPASKQQAIICRRCFSGNR